MGAKSQQLQIRVSRQQKAALKRAARRAGMDMSRYVLQRALPSGSEQFERLLAQLEADPDPGYALAQLHDLLLQWTASELVDATVAAGAAVSRLPGLLQNHVAALVEQAAWRDHVPPPAWAAQVAPLTEPFFATELSGLRLHLLRASPVPFRRRNLFVDTGLGGRV